MSIIQVKKMGEKSLLEVSLSVENFFSEALYTLIENIKDTMKQEDGVGIAGILYPRRIKDLRFFGYRETQLNKL